MAVMAWEPDYVDAEELAAYLRIEDENAENDGVELALAAAAASRSIDDYCRRQFGMTDSAEVRSFNLSCTGNGYVLHTDDVASDVGLLINGEAIDPVSQQLLPTNSPTRKRPWTSVYFSAYYLATDQPVEITAVWGWPDTVPSAVEQAARIQAARFFKRRDAPFGIAGSPESGSELRLLAKLDPDVAVLLHRYRRIARPR